MLERDEDIYASTPVRRLQGDQMRLLASDMQRCSGTHGLLLTVNADETPPACPLLGCWVTLHVTGSSYRGDLKAATDEALPFVDDAFQLVLVRHALELASMPAAVLEEVVRVVEPGGTLVVTGIHPISLWSPWFCLRTRRSMRRLQFPWMLRAALLRAGMEIQSIRRVGRSWPRQASAGTLPGNLLGGGYVLIARKRRHVITRLHISRVPVAVSSGGRLSPGTRRNAAL